MTTTKPLSNNFYPSRTTICTRAFSQLLADHHANVDHFFFVVRLVAQADENRVRAAKALLPSARDEDERLRLEKTATDPDLVLREIQRHSTVTSRNLTNGIVNAFQRYFSSVINEAALKRPTMMMSSQQIKIEEVFRFKRHKDLVAYIIDKKVNELAYGGLAEMERYFNDRLGVRMFENSGERAMLRLFVEARNINVHNGGMVNDLFVSRVGSVEGFSYTVGKPFHVDMEALFSLTDNAMKVALNIDALVAQKFGLKRQSHLKWREPKSSKAGELPCPTPDAATAAQSPSPSPPTRRPKR